MPSLEPSPTALTVPDSSTGETSTERGMKLHSPEDGPKFASPE